MHKVEEIHKSKLFGVIVETGCGAAITSELMSVSGASNTIYSSSIPYSKECEHRKYGNDFGRSVSAAFIQTVIAKESEIFQIEPKVNFILAASWQLNDGDLNKYVHGWIGVGLKDKSVTQAYHFSFDRSLVGKCTREQLLAHIGQQGANVLYSFINEDKAIELTFGACLDMAYTITDENDYIVNYDVLINSFETCDRDYPICFNNAGCMRFEDLMREGNEFVIMKGSFNPLHHMHKKMLHDACDKHPHSTSSYLISTYRYDKPHIDVSELTDHIKNICNHNEMVIVMKCIYFYETFNMLQRWSDQYKKFYFPVGTDVMQRIEATDKKNNNFDTRKYINNIMKNYQNFKFIIFKREGYCFDISLFNDFIEEANNETDNISSTSIRNGTMENKLDNE